MQRFSQRARAAWRAFQGAQPRQSMRAFSGAQMGRLTADWNPYIQSPTRTIQAALVILRARARQLVEDNSYAAGFLGELANNVVGPEGIMLQAKVRTATTGELHPGVNDAIEAAWTEWGMPEHASADGYESWTDQQKMEIRTIAQDGEIFIRKLKYFDNPFGFATQVIDADLVDEKYNRAPAPGVNEIRLGIEINGWGRPVAYHVWTAYAGDRTKKRERIRIPADEIIHKFVRYRANQVRGVTWFAPVLMNLHYLDGYEFSELTAARVAAAKMGFIINKQPEAIAAFEWKEGQEPRELDVEPGLFEELLPGQEVQTFDATHPSTAFKDFTKTILRSIARGLGMAYTTLTGDLEAVNYSSIRAGLLSERDHFRSLQKWMAVHICRPIYRDWVQMALLSGALKLDSRISSNFYQVEWRGRGWKWVDPVNDLTAAALAIALGLDSRQHLAAEQGRDFEEIVDEIAAELEYADAVGVDVSGAGAAPSAEQLEQQNRQQQQPFGDGSEPDDTSNDQTPKDDAKPDTVARARARKIRALKMAIQLLERRAA
jgi:lambda family phage portal protein